MLPRGLSLLRGVTSRSVIECATPIQYFTTTAAVTQKLPIDPASKKHILERSDFADAKGLRYSHPELANGNRSERIEELTQVPVPNYPFQDEAPVFKGLETDFPCLARAKNSGPEPNYENIVSGYNVYHHDFPFELMHSKGVLPCLEIAYETWGELNENRDNAILLCTGLSASSHAKSHPDNDTPGWWEKFIGPGCALDTNKYFVVCTNNLGGCYGTTGPSSKNPLTDQPYGTTFPIVTVEDQIRSQFLLVDHLGISKLYACVGSSLGGMQSLTAAVMFPERVGKTVSISACASTHPTAIVLRYLQRKAIMMDPQWHQGHYYTKNTFPRFGMKLAREIGTITYRSGPEWDERFGRRRIVESDDPTLCPYFMIENYLEYQGEQFCTKYDPNSLIYISKAMDLFDLSETYGSIHMALARVKSPIMIIGVKTDMLFPVWQQRELAQQLQEAGNQAVTYYELNSIYGHDTFLLDLNGVGAGVKGFLDTHMAETGRTRKRKDH